MQVVIIDSGTYSFKDALFQNGNSTDIDIEDSVVLEITKEKQLDQSNKFGLEGLIPGFYTFAEIGERRPHALERWIQFDAMAQDTPLLETGIRNVIQQLELKTGVKLTGELNKWVVMFALSPKETQAARDYLQKVYQSVAMKLGFKGIYTLDQMSFDIIGTYPTWHSMKKETESTQEKTLMIVNIGGGDTKVCPIADQPLAIGLVTKTIGGQLIIDYGSKIMHELSSSPITNKIEIKGWVKNSGSVLGYKPDDWNETTEKIVMYNGVNYAINSIVRAPEMFFEPENPLYQKPKDYAIHRMIHESIEKVKKAQTLDEQTIKEWLGCIVLTGGASQFYGMADRLKRELKEIYPGYVINVKVANNPQETCVNGMIAKLTGFWKNKKNIENEKHYVSLEREGSEK